MINEPNYGLTAGRGTDKVALAAALEYVRRKVCCYNLSIERDVHCDCKYGLSIEDGERRSVSSEQTGCPELREVIYLLLHGDDSGKEPDLSEESHWSQIHPSIEQWLADL